VIVQSLLDLVSSHLNWPRRVIPSILIPIHIVNFRWTKVLLSHSSVYHRSDSMLFLYEHVPLPSLWCRNLYFHGLGSAYYPVRSSHVQRVYGRYLHLIVVLSGAVGIQFPWGALTAAASEMEELISIAPHSRIIWCAMSFVYTAVSTSSSLLPLLHSLLLMLLLLLLSIVFNFSRHQTPFFHGNRYHLLINLVLACL